MRTLTFCLQLPLLFCVVLLLGCAPEGFDAENQPPVRQDLTVEDVRIEFVTTGTLTEVLTAKKGRYLNNFKQMRLTDVHIDFIRQTSDPETGETTHTVTGTLDATTGTYYLQPVEHEGKRRFRDDIDMIADGDEYVIHDKASLRLVTRHLYFHMGDTQTISTSGSYVYYDHNLKSATGTARGFVYYPEQSEGDDVVIRRFGSTRGFQYLTRAELFAADRERGNGPGVERPEMLEATPEPESEPEPETVDAPGTSTLAQDAGSTVAVMHRDAPTSGAIDAATTQTLNADASTSNAATVQPDDAPTTPPVEDSPKANKEEDEDDPVVE